MKKQRIWYECDYCGTDMLEVGLVYCDGYGGIRDDNFSYDHTVDICDNPKCYQKHLKRVKEKMLEDDEYLLYPLDILESKCNAEYEKYKDGKFKVKWNSNDKWHIYQRETLVKLLMPLYEKYCIYGNGK